MWLASFVMRAPGKKWRRVGFWVLLGALAAAVVVPALIWPSAVWAPLISAAAAVVSAAIAARKADVSADDADRAEAAQATAEKAARAAHLGLAYQAHPEVGVWWYRPASPKDFTHWDLHLTADRPAKNIVAEWHFVDGREPVRGSWPEIEPGPNGLGLPTTRLVIPLGIPASVKPADVYHYLARGTLEFTDAAGLARWRTTWRYVPLGPEDDPRMQFLNAPKAEYESELVELLELPDLD
ncbi:hypothetical protein PSET11_02473 [Arthrobacter ulcerisalmonis]|uniref:Uncharacterized protein n=1 Tax=Arthrobacter ulcerisalmonis TaxID=2483813 RepID=A0A3P5XNJ6_9MICC|nr:hypothetical protein PSET11_02473 [Arthrobacter ulcerisalmonis]